jgi:hypothetical protein
MTVAIDPMTALPVISLRSAVRRIKGVTDSEDVSGAVEQLRDDLEGVRLFQVGSDACITWDDFLAYVARKMAQG